MSVSILIKNSCSTTGEGPHWDDPTQSLLYVDIVAGDVHRWNSATGEDQKLHLQGGEASLIVPSSAGGYIVSVGNTLGHLDWDTNTYTKFAEVDAGKNNRFNDGKCDPKGRLWAGTMGREVKPAVVEIGAGSLYTLDKQKKVVKQLSGLSISNGLAWSEDNRTMYFIDSIPGNIFAYDYDIEQGTINAGSQRVVMNFGDGKTNQHGLPDGMTIDTEGKLWVACYGKGKVIRVDPETGKILQEVSVPNASRTTSCCFGGKNLDELYITCARTGISDEDFKTTESLAGSVFKVTGLGVKGRPAYVFQA